MAKRSCWGNTVESKSHLLTHWPTEQSGYWCDPHVTDRTGPLHRQFDHEISGHHMLQKAWSSKLASFIPMMIQCTIHLHYTQDSLTKFTYIATYIAIVNFHTLMKISSSISLQWWCWIICTSPFVVWGVLLHIFEILCITVIQSIWLLLECVCTLAILILM